MEVASLAGGAALRLPVHGAADLGIADSSTEFMDGPSGFCAGNMCTLDLASFSASACAAVREAVLGGGMAL
eukprot:gene13434-15874_t